MNYEEDIRIDENSLDIEWLDQAALMMKYSINSAKAQKKRDRLKVDLDLITADLDKRIRMKPSKYGMEKITENAVRNIILSDDEYTQAQDAYMEAVYEANIAQSAVWAFDARKTALENMVKLHGQQYFAGPRIPRDLSTEREAKQRKVDSSISQKIQRRNK